MACGKTTLARALARSLGREFIDLDLYIEQRFHARISEIFATRGEEEFRRMEAAMLREAGAMLNVVVACGGGTPCFHDNAAWMLENGSVVFLDTTEECIVRRLAINRSRRPLMADKSEEELREAVARGLSARRPFYEQCHIRYPGDRLENRAQIAETVAALTPLLP